MCRDRHPSYNLAFFTFLTRPSSLLTLSVLLTVLTLSAACQGEETSVCGNQVCKKGFVCDGIHEVCVVPEQLEACIGKPDGDQCFIGGQSGFVCDKAVCLLSRCGDGILDVHRGEECDDGDGHNSNVTPGGCRLSCLLPYCGDGILDPGEECDGNKLGGQTCVTLFYDSGVLACASGCTFDPAGCESQCGNGLKSPDEGCDDGNLVGNDGCSNQCEVEIGWECLADNPSHCTTLCGDGLIRGDEECDDSTTTPGDGCGPTCTVETGWDCSGEPSQCEEICGDDLAVGAEPCDGVDLKGASCVSQGLHGGTLACQAACHAFETSGCYLCGDGVCREDAGESFANCPEDCAITGTCATVPDLTAQDGCNIDEKCTLVDSSGTIGCEAAGATADYAACGAGGMDDCLPGALCVGPSGGPYACLPFCDAAHPCTGGMCFVSISTAAGQATLCFPFDGCDPYDASGCGTGEGCYIVTAMGDTICIPAGSTPVGGSCSYFDECGIGAQCLGNPGVCSKLCKNNDDCTSPSTCQGIGEVPSHATLGVCA